MRNFFLTLAVLIGGAFVAKAECGCGERIIVTGEIVCGWYYYGGSVLIFDCWNRTDCEIIEPKDPDYVVCQITEVRPADVDLRKPHFPVEVEVDKRRDA